MHIVINCDLVNLMLMIVMGAQMKFTHLSDQEQVMNVVQWHQIIAMFYNKITVNDYMYVHVIPTRFLKSSNEIYLISLIILDNIILI
jgi:hypothetical protein